MRKICLITALIVAGCNAPNDDQALSEKEESGFDGADYRGKQEMLAYGERLVAVMNCHSCHGPDLTGGPFPPQNDPPTGIISANLTHAMKRLSDDEFETILRTGRHPDGRDLYYMPSQIYRWMTDRDLKALTAYLRTLEPKGEDEISQATPGYLASRKEDDAIIQPAAQMVASTTGKEPPKLGDGLVQGRYIVMTSCAECHGGNLEGYAGFSPPLTVSSAYDDAQFDALLTTGKSFDGRDIGLMGMIGGYTYSHLTENERRQVIAYIRAWTEWKTAQSE